MIEQVKQVSLRFPWSNCSQDQIQKAAGLQVLAECVITRCYLKFCKENFSQVFSFSEERRIYLQIKNQYIVIFDKTHDKVIDLFQCSLEISVLIKEINKTRQEPQGQMKKRSVDFRHGQEISHIMIFEIKSQEDQIRSFEKEMRKNYILQRGFHESIKALRKIGKMMESSMANIYIVNRFSDSASLIVKAFQKSLKYAEHKGLGKAIVQQEIRMLSHCRHPYICGFEGIYESENSIYIVMEKYEYTLYDLVEKQFPVSRRTVISLMQKMLSAVAYLHDNGIVHRDLKLDNVLIRKTEVGLEPVVIDFGLAEYYRKQVYFYERAGTPGFASPQIFLQQRSEAPEKCDIFALGVIFHYLLFKKLVFEGSNANELLINTKDGKLSVDKEGLLNEDPNISSLLMRMLEIDCTRRISAREALEHPLFNPSKALPSTTSFIRLPSCECLSLSNDS